MMKFKVVRYEFNPSEVGKERMVECGGYMCNVPKSTPSTSSVVKKNLTERRAKALRDQLNSKTELSADVECIVGYRIAPMGLHAS